MATKKMKGLAQNAATEAQSTWEGEDPLPGQLEREFRKSLGRHNMHLNMLDMSAQVFANTLSKQPSEKNCLRECAKELGFHSLYPNVSFASARGYLIYSHIAYVFSAGDMLCDRIRSTASIKSLKRSDTSLFNEIDDGDFIRKTLALTVLATLPPEKRNASAVIAQVDKIRQLESFALVNYYRLIRNEELHAASESVRKSPAARAALSEERIKARYGMMPSPVGELSPRDALLCSKAWQSVAKWLCRHMVNDTDVQIILKERFGRLEAKRRGAAALKFMQLELLYSKEEINAMMFALQW